MPKDNITEQIERATKKAGKVYGFNDDHKKTHPANFWFQQSNEGLILFVVFYSLACRWSRCLGCNLPSVMSKTPVDFKSLMAQVDACFAERSVAQNLESIEKVIVSNNGSVLDQQTFSSTALMYLLAQLNLKLPNLSVLSIETRPEFVELAELEFMARAIAEGQTSTQLEIAIGIEAFDEHIRNDVYNKGVTLKTIDQLAGNMAQYGFRLKCYFMQKPVQDMSDEDAVRDIHKAINYLDQLVNRHGLCVNMHLNPTYVAKGTVLEKYFNEGRYAPPRLKDVAEAAAYGEGKRITIYLGLSDEGLAVKGGSFLRKGDEGLVKKLEQFNQTQNYDILNQITKSI